MDSVKQSHDKKLSFLYMLCILCLICYVLIRKDFLLYGLLICLVMLGIVYLMDKQARLSQYKYLIRQTEAIMDQKSLPIIDGEGDISLLSHKLFMLSHRYYSLIETMNNEQVQLKNYIEDISHQLKTPITSMRLNEELLLESVTDQAQRTKLQILYQQTNKMNQLVNDLLTLALLDSHSIEFHFQDYPVESLIDSVDENLEHLLLSRHMALRLINHDISILCDHKWFVEALENIIKNCIEKNHNDYIDIVVSESESLVLMKIQDHGQGFCEEDIPHLFERFYRGEKPKGEGIGIGLALAKQIIEEHHGLIRAYNNHGAVFEISLPKILAKKKYKSHLILR